MRNVNCCEWKGEAGEDQDRSLLRIPVRHIEKQPIIKEGDYMDFASTLTSLMGERSLTIGRLARETGVSKSSLHGYLQGAEPSLTNMLKLSCFLGVTLDFLATGKAEDPIERLLKVEVHNGLYEVNIKRVARQGKE